MSPSLIKLFFMSIVGVIFVIVAVKLFKRAKYYSFETIKGYFLKKSIIRPASFLICLAYFSALMLSLMFAPCRASMKISLNYAEASKGQNMNGTRYNMSEILCDDVLERTIKKGAFKDVTAKQLKKTLDVYPTVSGSAVDKTRYHVSTEFRIDYIPTKDTYHIDGYNFLPLLSECYREFLIDNYADNLDTIAVNINPEEDFKDLGYFDICNYLSMEAEILENYMSKLSKENSSFIASNGETFNSVASKLYKLRSEKITDDLYAMIVNTGISKSYTTDLKSLQYEVVLLDFEKQKKEAGRDISSKAVEMYKEAMARIVLVPTVNEEGEFYMGQTKIGLDELVEDSANYSTEAASYAKKIEDKNNIIDSVKAGNGTMSNESIDTLIVQISKAINEYSQEASQVALEYSNTNMNRCVNGVMYPKSYKRDFAISFILTIGMFLALTGLYAVRQIPKRETEKYFVETENTEEKTSETDTEED